MFELQFDRSEILDWAEAYSYEDDGHVETTACNNRSRGYLTRPEFLALCEWKTKCSKSKVAKNPEGLVHEATSLALSAEHEQMRIFPLLGLYGVSWPTASGTLSPIRSWTSVPFGPLA